MKSHWLLKSTYLATPIIVFGLLAAPYFQGALAAEEQQQIAVAGCTAITSGLISCWSADGTTNDSQGANNGTTSGTVTYGTGVSGQAFRFNGNGSVVVPDSSTLDLTTHFTLSAWINPSVSINSPYGVIIGKFGGAAGNNGYQLSMDSNNFVLASNFNAANETWPGTSLAVTHSTRVPVGEWTHVAATYDNQTLRIYRNGVLTGSLAAAGKTLVNSAANFRISGNDSENGFFYGLIDEVAVYNRALSATELLALTNAPVRVTAPTAFPAATTGQAYSQAITASGGAGGYTFAVSAGSLPAGLTLSTAGVVSGTPTGASGGSFTVTVTDSAGTTNQQAFSISVISPTTAGAGRILTNSGSAFAGLIMFNTDGSNTVNLTPNTFDGGDGATRSYSGHPTVSRNGVVAFQSNRDGSGSRIYAINLDGTGLRQVTTSQGLTRRGADFPQDVYPSISPDGTRIAFLSQRNSFTLPNVAFYDIFVVNLDGSGLRQVSVTEGVPRNDGFGTVDYGDNRSVVWGPDGVRLAFRGSRFETFCTDTGCNSGRYEMLGMIDVDRQIESTLAVTLDCGTGSALDWSIDGRIVYTYGGAIQGCPQQLPKILLFGQSEIPAETLGSAQNGNGMVRFSPDGQRLMYFNATAYNSPNQPGAVTLINLDGTNRTSLPATTGINPVFGAPLWWTGGAAMPAAASFSLSPNPVNVAFGGPGVQMQGTLYAANGDVIVNAATGWSWEAQFNVTGLGLVTATNTDARTDRLCANNAGVSTCVNVARNTGATSSTGGGSSSTPVGTNVEVKPTTDTSVKFGSVTAGGDTSATPVVPSAAGTLPTNMVLGTVAYNFATTGTVSGTTTVCVRTPDVTDATVFSRQRLLKNESGALVDRTIMSGVGAPDFSTRRLCASTTSLSTFAVASVNVQPSVSAIANQSINEDAATADLAITISDVETAAASLTLSASSSDLTLVPTSAVTFGGSGASRTVRVTPAANQFGTTMISITVADGHGGSATTQFTVTVAAVNDPPTLALIADQSITQGASTSALAITIDDVETAAANLTVAATSSNTTLVPSGGLLFAGSGANRTLTVTPSAANSGNATISVTVTDGAGATATRSFALTVTAAAPNAPTGLTGTADGSIVHLSWTAPAVGPTVTSYTVEAGTSAGASTITMSTGGTTTSFSLNLQASGTFFVRVRAVNATGAGSPSNEVSITTSQVPSRPRDLAFSIVGTGATFTWSAPLTGTPAGYVIEAGSATGSSNLATLPTGSTATTLSVPQFPVGTFYIRLRALNGFGQSLPSNEVVVTYPVPPVLPGAPSNLVATASGNDVVITWQPAASGGAPSTYILEAGTSAGGSNLAVAPVGLATTFAQSGVPSGTYFLRVRAQNAAGISPASNEVTLVVGAPVQLPGAPVALTGTAGAGGAVSLTWSPPTTGGAPITYVLDVGTASGLSNVVQLAVGPTTTLSTTGVPAGTYFIRVRAVNSAGSSPASNEIRLVVP